MTIDPERRVEEWPRPIHPLEIVEKSDIDRVISANIRYIDKEIFDQIAVVRADYVGYLMRIDSFHNGISWATFRGYEGGGSLLDSGDAWRAAVIFKPGVFKGTKLIAPILRVIFQEEYRVDDGLEYLTQDLMIDNDGDAFVSISSFPMRESSDIETLDISAPIFFVQDGKLGIDGSYQYPDIRFVSSNVDGIDVHMLPFGFYSESSTRLDAIERLKIILARIKNGTIDDINTKDND